MAAFLYKIRCPDPEHVDGTPSCGVYADGSGYCFSCSKYFKKVAEPTKEVTKHIEDLNDKFTYINSLPTTHTRGLIFPFDNDGYYILWPSGDYYKLRRWTSLRGGDKYLSPSGHHKPLFRLPGSKVTSNLLIVEGEINALSIHPYISNCDVLCPGSASSFTDRMMLSALPEVTKYVNIVICVDADVAGLAAALKLKELLRSKVLNITIKLMEKDFNELLVEYGKYFKNNLENLDMPAWVQFD